MVKFERHVRFVGPIYGLSVERTLLSPQSRFRLPFNMRPLSLCQCFGTPFDQHSINRAAVSIRI